MATLAASPLVVPAGRSFGAALGLFAKETKYEFLKLWRTKSFSLAVIGFPVMFYLVFGVANRNAHDGAVAFAKYLLAGYAASGMVSAALFGIGVGMASERAAGWLELKCASPMPRLAYVVAKCITAQVFGSIVVAVLIAIAIPFGGVQLTLREAALLLAMPLIGTIPFAALGLFIAQVVPANSASGVVNIIYMPMAVMSGLWIPIRMLPHWMQALAPGLPTYHLGQLTLALFGYQSAGSLSVHWLGLLGFTLLAFGAAWAAFSRSEQAA